MFLTPHFKRFQSIRCENLKEFIKNDFEKLLLVLNGFNMIDDDNVVGIVCLARKYGVESVTRKCEQFLIGDSKKTPEHLTKIAEEYSLDLLKHFRKPPTVNEEIMKCLECPVCYSTYKDIPRILQCGHTFCLECLNQLHIRKCPTCWRVFAPGGQTFCNTCLKELISSAKCPICCKVFVPGNATLNYALMNVIDAVSPESTNRSEQAPNTALRHQCKTSLHERVRRIEERLGLRQSRSSSEAASGREESRHPRITAPTRSPSVSQGRRHRRQSSSSRSPSRSVRARITMPRRSESPRSRDTRRNTSDVGSPRNVQRSFSTVGSPRHRQVSHRSSAVGSPRISHNRIVGPPRNGGRGGARPRIPAARVLAKGCALCQRTGHGARYCPVFDTLESRWALVRRETICTKCLSKNHGFNCPNFRVSRGCQLCKGAHHAALCGQSFDKDGILIGPGVKKSAGSELEGQSQVLEDMEADDDVAPSAMEESGSSDETMEDPLDDGSSAVQKDFTVIEEEIVSWAQHMEELAVLSEEPEEEVDMEEDAMDMVEEVVPAFEKEEEVGASAPLEAATAAGGDEDFGAPAP